MLKVIAQDFIRLDAVDTVMPLYRELVELTRLEPLNIDYELCIDQEDPGHFIFLETWPDRAALDAHCETEHFRRLVPQIDAFQRSADTYIQMRVAFPAS
ncbi:MAG: antibiotic biosynthesis monooxygenase [Leucobacter sp.]|nr:antibiotic biosynthesis monooxygenase [Leucobacter sp.]